MKEELSYFMKELGDQFVECTGLKWTPQLFANN